MNRKTIMQEIALRLKKIRETLGISPVDMTKRIGTYRTNYYKYENGRSFPHFTVLARLGNNLGVSLDWLILDKGPMFFKEKDSAILILNNFRATCFFIIHHSSVIIHHSKSQPSPTRQVYMESILILLPVCPPLFPNVYLYFSKNFLHRV
ncbi:MAG: helix-turn-helix transcriptional regulator [Candidatus Aminicenantes bacterium]|nr:helix-turn-helix transcriptional regulator [Candidatus Aminicenantes bacterium]